MLTSSERAALPQPIGFIGLGNMGAPMAGNLLGAGFRIVVNDLHRAAADALLSRGATWAESAVAVAQNCEIVCVSVPGPDETRALRAAGFFAAVRAGGLVIDFTTNAPLLVRELDAELSRRGAALLDAPVSGGVTGARSRRLTVQVGGDAAAVLRVRPVLDAVADTVIHVGASGAGNICKLLHNCAVFCADLAMVECLTAGIKAGVAPETLIEVFQKSGIGRNHDLHVAMPARLFRGNFSPPHFALKTAMKDMGLATELARAVNVPMALAEHCEEEMRSAVARGWGDADENIFLTLQEERAGVQVRAGTATPDKSMKHFLTGLDHPVIAVHDLDDARVVYERLGFIVPPRGRHSEWGTGNWCIQFANDYLELRGFCEPSAAPQTRELLAFLARREGLMGIAFGTTGAQASHDSLAAAGLNPRPVKPLTRDFELPEGTVPVSFQLCFLPQEATPGLMHVVVCEHLTPERLRRPEWLLHPNGARRVAGLVAVAEEPCAAFERWSRLFERVAAIPGGLEAHVGTGYVLLLDPASARRRYPGVELPPTSEWPALAAVVLEVEELARTRMWFAARSIDYTVGERVVVPPADACGTLLEFVRSP